MDKVQGRLWGSRRKATIMVCHFLQRSNSKYEVTLFIGDAKQNRITVELTREDARMLALALAGEPTKLSEDDLRELTEHGN